MTSVRKRWHDLPKEWRSRGDDPVPYGPVSHPVPSFTVVKASLTVHVDASGSTDVGGTITSYAWTYGDGTSATGVSPTGHTYANAGSYPITLTVTDDLGNSAVASQVVTVSTLLALFTITNVSGLAIRVTASTASTTPVASYGWTFGDGTVASGPVVDHTYPAAGVYPIVLTVTGTDGTTASQSQSVSVSALVGHPTASFTTSTTGRALTVDGSASASDNGFTISSWVWQWGDGTANSSGRTATHTYAVNGSYPVTLRVTDTSSQTATTSTTVTVTGGNVPPTAAFTTQATNLTVAFDGSGSVDPDGTIASYAWAFGDSATGTGRTANHTYAAAGSYTARLTVTDNLGATGTITHNVTVTQQPTGGVPNWDHIVVVMEENHGYNQVVGSSSAPYINGTLIAGGLNFTQMHSGMPVSAVSEGSYFQFFAGSNFGVTDDGTYWFSSANQYTQLKAAGMNLLGYAEGLPSVGYTGATSGAYARKHAPWVSWQPDPTKNPNGNFPAVNSRPFTEWQNNVTFYAALPKVTWVIPNLSNDMHDGTDPARITTADTWLKTHLDGYAQWAKANNSLLIVSTDEDENSEGNHIMTVAYGAHITPGSTYTATINHYDLLGLMQDSAGVPRLLGSVGKPSITSPWSGSAPTWQQFWSDEFTGTTVNTATWTVDDHTAFGSGNNELETNLAANATVANSLLSVTARKLTSPVDGKNYSSAHLSSNGKQQFTIGPGNALKLEVRAQLPDVTHLLPAPVWLRPADAGMGEVDPIEATGTTDTDNAGNTRISQTVHTLTYSPDTFTAAVWNLTDTGGVTNMHVYGVEVYSDHTVFFVDGVQTARIDSSSAANGGGTLGSTYAQIFGTNRPWFMHITLGVGGNWPGTPTAATIFPAVMNIDWIRAYRLV